MPTEAASDPELVRGMLVAGMDCMRINCAHDAAPEWHRDARQPAPQPRADGPPGARGGRPARARSCAPDRSPAADQRRKGDYLRLRVGDRLLLTRESDATADRRRRRGAALGSGARFAEAFDVTRRGHQVWLDDGKIGGVVESVDADSIELRITVGRRRRARSCARSKGINLPDAVLDIDLLGAHSEDALRFAAERADIVGLSFVSRAREVKRVHEYLDRHAGPEVGMILKIETRRAFEHLPGLLLAALGGERPAGVMIARGDLAVECGYERLAEVQEEILWLCQAAHMPVIWATQVLDRLAKTGRPSRAEITDAAMGEQAECVMLNKGPRIVEAISVLDDILRRMERHQRKKRPLLPRCGSPLRSYAPVTTHQASS